MDSESEHQEDSVPTDPVEIAAVEEEPTATEEDLQPIDAPATTPPSVDTQTQASAIVEEDTPTIGEPEQQESPSQDQAPSALEDTVTAETAPSQAQQEVSIHSEPEAPAPPAHSDSFSKAPEETPSYRRGSDFSSVRESVVEDVRAPIAQHVGMSIAVSQIKKPGEFLLFIVLNNTSYILKQRQNPWCKRSDRTSRPGTTSRISVDSGKKSL